MKNTWIYERTEDNRARFLLGRPGRKTFACIGINSSTAAPEKLDRTVATVARYSAALGYDSWMMLNVYPQRATDPDDMHTEPDPEYCRLNLKAITEFFAEGPHDIWAAWGTLITKRAYLKDCLKDIYRAARKYPQNWYTIGRRSMAGHPHHPLYLKNGLPLDRFDVEEYILSLHP
jgi:hypothetical protein